MKLFSKRAEIKALQNELAELKGFIDYGTQDQYSYGSVYGLSSIEQIQVTPRMAYLLSEKNGDLGKAVGDISAALASLTKGIKMPNGEIDYKHPLVQLLNKPGGGYNKLQFFREISESFLLMNECYIVARGNINRPPLALDFIRPYDVSITMDYTTGEPATIQTTSMKDRHIYTPEVVNGTVRYLDSTGLNELLIIRGAVSINTDEWRGRSPITKLYYDVLLSNSGKQHNTSLLQNGMRTSGIMSPKPQSGENQITWQDPKIKKLQEYIRTFAQGAGNAGNFLVVGTPTEIQGLTQSNKDMDFAVLLQNSQIAIFNLYNVPLPLVLSVNMSYNNFTTANRTFYTKAVFPIFDQIAEGLLFNLRDRYKMTEDETLVYNDTDIRDLQQVLIENMKTLNETQVVTTNEVRRKGGFEDVEGGDDIFVLANKIPLSMMSSPDAGMYTDSQTPEQPVEDEDTPAEPEDEEITE